MLQLAYETAIALTLSQERKNGRGPVKEHYRLLSSSTITGATVRNWRTVFSGRSYEMQRRFIDNPKLILIY